MIGTDLLPGIVSTTPPVLECGDCRTRWTDGGRRGSIAYAVIQSGSSGWGFLRCAVTNRCPSVRRCSDCNEKHRAEHDVDAEVSVLQHGVPSRTRRRKVGLR